MSLMCYGINFFPREKKQMGTIFMSKYPFGVTKRDLKMVYFDFLIWNNHVLVLYLYLINIYLLIYYVYSHTIERYYYSMHLIKHIHLNIWNNWFFKVNFFHLFVLDKCYMDDLSWGQQCDRLSLGDRNFKDIIYNEQMIKINSHSAFNSKVPTMCQPLLVTLSLRGPQPSSLQKGKVNKSLKDIDKQGMYDKVM